MVDQPSDVTQSNAPAGLDEFIGAPAQGASTPVSAPPPGLEEFIAPELKEEKYGTLGQQAITGLEGMASAATFGLSTGIEVASGLTTPEDIRGRSETNPFVHGVGQVGGLIIPGFIPGLGEAAAAKAVAGEAAAKGFAEVGAAKFMSKAGDYAAEKLGVAAGERAVDKIGSAAVKGLVENTIFQTGDEISKGFAQDPNQDMGSIAANIGLAGLIGGGFGGAVGSVSPLWKATVGPKVEGYLKTFTDRLGGIEGQEAGEARAALKSVGLEEPTPSQIAMVSTDPMANSLVRSIAEGETSDAAKVVHSNIQALNTHGENVVLGALGKTTDQVEKMGSTSLYEAGERVGKEYLDPLKKRLASVEDEFASLEAKTDHIKLDNSITDKAEPFVRLRKDVTDKIGNLMQKMEHEGDPGRLIEQHAQVDSLRKQLSTMSERAHAPGTIDGIVEDINKIANERGWLIRDKSPIGSKVKSIFKDIKKVKTLKDLRHFENDLDMYEMGNGKLNEAGMKIKEIIREARSDVMHRELGTRFGAEAAERFQGARAGYRDLAQLKDELNSTVRLSKSKSPGAFLDNFEEALRTNPERMLERLARDKDANFLKFTQEKFPEAAVALKEHIINSLIQAGKKGASGKENINVAKIAKAYSAMTPEMQKFAVGAEAGQKILDMSAILDKVKEGKFVVNPMKQGFKDLGNQINTVGGFIAALAHGSLPVGMLLGAVAKLAFKDKPDAFRLAALKFMGTNKPIDAGAFKATVDAIHATIKGQNAVKKATTSLFKDTEKAAITSIGSARDRARLDALVQEAQSNPETLTHVGTDVSHYMPDHGMTMAATAANAIQFLNAQRPNTQQMSPLDSKLPPSPDAQAHYNRMLDLANNPLIVSEKIKNGTVTPKDILAIKTMYPGLYTALTNGYLTQMSQVTAKGGKVAYKTRIGLSMFVGMPLDSTLSGHAISLAQPKPNQSQQPQNKMKPPANSSVKGLSKMVQGYSTPGQAREQHAQKR